LVQRRADCAAEGVGVEVVQRDADDPDPRDEPGTRKMEKARQQLSPGQITGCTNENDDLRKSRATREGFRAKVCFLS
jgi:hypothetical protein